jgi:mono/diheme cytochrome c family protein
MNLIKKYIFLLSVVAMMSISACQQPGGNSTGSEFMPDMAHSIAYEANYYNYYYNNTWGSEEEYYNFAKPKMPVKGTIPRGAAGNAGNDAGINVPANGYRPYTYDNTEEDRIRASAEITTSPFPISDKGLAVGKELYIINCGICHGDKGDGAGYLVRDDGGKYPVQPANFLLDDFVDASNGRYYHAIIYGKNLMGGYADKLSHEERWNVIQYIRSLQAAGKGLVYSATENTFNSDLPLAMVKHEVKEDVIVENHVESVDSHDSNSH